MKKIILPAKVTIGFDLVDGQVALVRFDVKYRTTYTEYPEIPVTPLVMKPVLTEEQEEQIITFCRNVILPQILGE